MNTCYSSVSLGWLVHKNYSLQHLAAHNRTTSSLHAMFKFWELLGSTLYIKIGEGYADCLEICALHHMIPWWTPEAKISITLWSTCNLHDNHIQNMSPLWFAAWHNQNCSVLKTHQLPMYRHRFMNGYSLHVWPLPYSIVTECDRWTATCSFPAWMANLHLRVWESFWG
jgi:hypothetical protein